MKIEIPKGEAVITRRGENTTYALKIKEGSISKIEEVKCPICGKPIKFNPKANANESAVICGC